MFREKKRHCVAVSGFTIQKGLVGELICYQIWFLVAELNYTIQEGGFWGNFPSQNSILKQVQLSIFRKRVISFRRKIAEAELYNPRGFGVGFVVKTI